MTRAELVRTFAQRSAPHAPAVTSVLDRGLSLAQVDRLVELPGVDIVKLGWGTAVVTRNLEAKLARYRAAGIAVVFGGTLTELAIVQGRVDQYLRWLDELGVGYVEVSDGTIDLPHADKLRLIARFAEHFTVLSEVGSKNPARVMAPAVWVQQMQRELAAGAWKVIAEARESGTAGIYEADGDVREGLIDAIAESIALERLLFEAPRPDQQKWFIGRFGAAVSLGNIAPADVPGLERLRLGRRSDTLSA